MEKILIFILILLSYSASSQDNKIDSDFKTDITYHFTVEESEFTSGDEEETKDFSLLKYIDVSFTNVDTGIVCVWKYKEEKAVSKNKILDNSIFSSIKGFEVEISFNPQQGEIVLLNYEKMKGDIKNYLIASYNILNQTGPSVIQIIENQIVETCSTPEDLLSTYFPEINLYFELYTQNIKYGVELIKEDSFPNPFKYGGEPFPIHIETIIGDSIENTIVVKKVESTKREETDSIIYEMGKSMIKPGGSPLKIESLPKFTFNIVTNYYYDRTLKLINRITYNKVVDVNGNTESKTLELNLIK